MALTTLGLAYSDYYERLRRYLGFPETPDSDDEADLLECMDDGLMNFYNAYDWSFLRKRTTIATVSGDYDTDLPSDFAILRGRFHFAADEGYHPLENTTPDLIDSWRTVDSSSRRPRYAAVHYKSSDQTAVQDQEVLFYPTPDGAYTLTYEYEVKRYQIRSGTDYPLGSEIHSQTILQFMLAEAELKRNDHVGVHHARLYGTNGMPGLLQISMDKDNDQGPDYLGDMVDHSDNKQEANQMHRYINGDVTYNT